MRLNYDLAESRARAIEALATATRGWQHAVGRDRNGIKAYLTDVFHEALSAPAPPRETESEDTSERGGR